MLDWKTPDLDFVRRIHNSTHQGSDLSPGNILLLRDKYDILTAEAEGAVFRYYRGRTSNRRGYGFPIAAGSFDGERIFSMLRRDAKSRGVPFGFCLCDERQRKCIDDFLRVEWQSVGGDSDYIYKRESLAALTGRKLHAKKSNANRFWRTYAEASYRLLSRENLADALRVAEAWVAARPEEGKAAHMGELARIRQAAENWEALRFLGGLLYVGETPAAMTMASPISEDCLDLHYEKVVPDFAPDGAYAALNQAFAASEATASYRYFNWEEDMGVPGLRQAKEAYRPAFKLEKFYGCVRP